jgi:MFS family permease
MQFDQRLRIPAYAASTPFGPYVAVFLAQQKWTQQNIGFVLTAAGFAGLLTQLPAGELLDATRSKRAAVALGATMVAIAALIIWSWPSFPLVLTALVLQATTGGFLGLAVAAISLGLVGHAALGERLGRNQRFASTGGVLAASLMGLIGYFLSYRAIFLAAAALVVPLLFALGRIQPSDIHFGRACGLPNHHGPSAPPRARHPSVWTNRGLLTFAGCVFLFQMANASMLPLAGESLVYSEVPFSSLIVSALIIVPQVIVAVTAPWVGRRAKIWGRRPLLLVGFAALPIRALLFACTAINDSHFRAGARRSQRNNAWRADGTRRRRPHKGYWPIQPRAGLRRNGVRGRRLAQHHAFKCGGRKPRPCSRISGHRCGGPSRSAPTMVAHA